MIRKSRPGVPLFTEAERVAMCLEAQETSASAVATRYKTRVDNIYRWTNQLRKQGKLPLPAVARVVKSSSSTPAPATTAPQRRATDRPIDADEVRRLHEVIGKMAVRIESLESAIQRSRHGSGRKSDQEPEA